jgi:hypothetical protein
MQVPPSRPCVASTQPSGQLLLTTGVRDAVLAGWRVCDVCACLRGHLVQRGMVALYSPIESACAQHFYKRHKAYCAAVALHARVTYS